MPPRPWEKSQRQSVSTDGCIKSNCTFGRAPHFICAHNFGGLKNRWVDSPFLCCEKVLRGARDWYKGQTLATTKSTWGWVQHYRVSFRVKKCCTHPQMLFFVANVCPLNESRVPQSGDQCGLYTKTTAKTCIRTLPSKITFDYRTARIPREEDSKQSLNGMVWLATK